MRLLYILGLAGIMSGGFAGAAFAQQGGSNYLYAPQTGSTGYATGTTGAVPFYNNTARPLPMDQMIAGKNAPSYTYKNQIQPYNLGTQSMGDGTMSAEDFMRARSSRDQRAQQYENEYLQRLAARDAALNNPATGQAGAQAYNGGGQQAQPKRKKRLVYREDANPLAAPPLLFDPDQ